MSPPTPLAELARLFLRLGATSFGGPAAHIAMMQDEVVRKRGWMTATAFLDALSATNLIPGPNSTELAMHVGHQRAGARGLIVAGVSFIVPAALMVGALAAARDADQVDALAKKLGELGVKVDLSAHYGFVLDWKLIAPFDNTRGVGYKADYPPEEKVELTKSFKGKNGAEAKWVDHSTADPRGVAVLLTVRDGMTVWRRA